jgi:hypothetical protein
MVDNHLRRKRAQKAAPIPAFPRKRGKENENIPLPCLRGRARACPGLDPGVGAMYADVVRHFGKAQ